MFAWLVLIESNLDMKWQPTLKDYFRNYSWNDCCKWALVSEEKKSSFWL